MSTLIKVEEYLPRLIDDTIEEYVTCSHITEGRGLLRKKC